MEELKNNLGDLFKVAQKETKLGTKVEEKTAEIKELTSKVKEIDINGDYDENRNKLRLILEMLYKGNDLSRHYAYLDRRSTNIGLVEYSYNLILMKEKSLRDFKSRIEMEFE